MAASSPKSEPDVPYVDASQVQVVLEVDENEVFGCSNGQEVPEMSLEPALKDINSYKQTKMTRFFSKPNVVSVITKNPWTASNPNLSSCPNMVSNPEPVSNPKAAACLTRASNPGTIDPLASNPGCSANEMSEQEQEALNPDNGESFGYGGAAMSNHVEPRTNRKPGSSKHM